MGAKTTVKTKLLLLKLPPRLEKTLKDAKFLNLYCTMAVKTKEVCQDPGFLQLWTCGSSRKSSDPIFEGSWNKMPTLYIHKYNKFYLYKM